ncbi:MAG: Crp/Fnr family transcriptional regulator [Pseudobdellovibrionaceae bacterium]
MAGEKKVVQGAYLFREGDGPDAMYIIKAGSFAITKSKGSSEIILAEIGPGAMVGEMALFDRKPRSANVKALTDSEVVALPYDSLSSQLETLPVWVKAIMKTMNENIREANKKIKTLETSNPQEERYPPHVVNRLLSILNFVGDRYGTQEGDSISIPPNRLRNFTIQIFQEATNKMVSMTQALSTMGYFTIQDLGEGKQKIINLQPKFLFDFVDWYNDWLYKQDKDRSPAMSAEDVKVMMAVVHFAKKTPENDKGYRKINVDDIQNESMKDLGNLIKVEELNPLIEKKILPEKTMEEGRIFILVHLKDLESLTQYWKMIWDLKKLLK